MTKLPFMPDQFLTGRPQEVWLDNMGIKDWSINDDGFVDVKGTLNLEGKLGDLKRLPVKFGRVGGDFWCNNNSLVSLEGVPRTLGGCFYCYNNQLKSLEGAPERVVGDFNCRTNHLSNLEGSPKIVGSDFWCQCNQLVSLDGAPKEVGGWFYCSHNQLVSLEGVPKKVDGEFWCDHNLLVDFKGLESVSIGGGLIVTNPENVGRDNIFVSLDGLPKGLYGKIRGLDMAALSVLDAQHSDFLDVEI